uniref:MMS19 nucleotide excision repair protein n=1 Tax=Sinocyclocheilus rhinocerous TaxID=307959 RepID=A0A673GQR1_9TELE
MVWDIVSKRGRRRRSCCAHAQLSLKPGWLLFFRMAADNSVLLGLVEEFVSGQVDSKAAETSEKSIVNVIHCLSSCRLSLTSSQPQTRGRGVQLLSQVLQECYSSLSERELEVLLAFYENRLKDHYVIIPHVLQGLNALTKCSVLPPGSAVSILRSIFQDLHVQSLMLAERSCVYNILVSLMESKEEELKGLGADFIYGFVQSVDGERDPRNLLLAFQVARNIIHRGYDLGKFVEELFEVMSCYFPIDFSPPPSDPHRITQEELVLSLRAVLTGTSQFAEFLLPLIIEKLDSDIQSAKVDSLQTLVQLQLLMYFSLCLLHKHTEDSVLVAFQQSLCSVVFSALTESGAGLQVTATRVLTALGQQPGECSCGFSVEEVVAVCISLQKIAEHVRDSEGIGRFFHDIIIPHLLGLCLQAALQSRDAGQLFERKKQHLWDSSCHSFTSRQVEIPEIDRLLVQLEDLSCTGPHLFSYTFAAKCFAGLVNKMPAGEALDAVLERVMKRISVELENVSSAQRTQAFTLLLWVSKALLLRYHPLSTALTDKLFALLSDPALGSQVADGFCVLMSDSLDVLNRNCHADVRIMYRQRFFAENTTKIIQGFNSAEQEKKSYYLKALSHIVSNLPRQVQLTELPVLLPLLLEALSCADQAVQLSTLSCLQPVLLEPPAAIRNQLEALFSRLLTLTTSPAMKVRIASLQCVHALSRLPEHMVLPFRARVLKALAVPLDDTKRLVRMEAMVARGEWFLLGSPGGR